MLRRLIGSLFAISLALSGSSLATAPAAAYQGCQSGSSATLSQTSGPGGTSATFTVTIKDCNGNGVGGVLVNFYQVYGPGNCHVTFSSMTGITNAQGQASVIVTFPANCAGQYAIGASAPGVQLQAIFVETGGFPNTTLVSTPGPAPGWMLLVLAGSLAILVSGAALVRSFRVRS